MSSDSATAHARPVRRGSKGERTQGRILDAAEALFAERGYSATTLRDVAEAVDLRIPSLYNHFPSKDALYAAVLERGIRPILDAVARLMESGERPSVETVVAETMAVLAEHPRLPRLIQHETLAGGERLTPMLREWLGAVFSQSESALEQSPNLPWQSEQLPLLVLALYHEIVGYFTIAPFYRALNDVDLLSPEMLDRHTRFLTDLVNRLVPEDPD